MILFHQYNFVTQSAIYCARWFKNLSVYTIIPKSIITYLQTVSVFQLNVSFTMYAVTHNRLAKNAPSQNPPSNVNFHIFSNHGFLIGRYPYHQSQNSKQQAKKELHHILGATQYKLMPRQMPQSTAFCHMFQMNTTVVTSLETALYLYHPADSYSYLSNH